MNFTRREKRTGERNRKEGMKGERQKEKEKKAAGTE
jgi:hypothetical protein